MSRRSAVQKTSSKNITAFRAAGLALIASIGLIGCSEETSATANQSSLVHTFVDPDGGDFSFDGITATLHARLRIYDEKLDADEMERGSLIVTCSEGGRNSIALSMPSMPQAGLPEIKMVFERKEPAYSAALFVSGYEKDLDNLTVVGRISAKNGGLFVVDLSNVTLDMGRALYHQNHVSLTIYDNTGPESRSVADFSILPPGDLGELKRKLGLLIRTCDALQ